MSGKNEAFEKILTGDPAAAATSEAAKNDVVFASVNDAAAVKEPTVIKVLKRPIGRPKVQHRDATKTSEEGLPDGWTRSTFIIRDDLLKFLDDYSYLMRMTKKDALTEILINAKARLDKDETYIKIKELLEKKNKNK